MDRALGYVQTTFGSSPVEPAHEEAEEAEEAEDMVIVASRRGAPMWRVIQEIESTLGQGRAGAEPPAPRSIFSVRSTFTCGTECHSL